jgi:serine/threonine protein kinase
MTIVFDSSIFKKLNRGTFRGMFNTNDTVRVNGSECIITGKKVMSAYFMICLRDGDIIFEIHFKFKSDETGSLDSMNIMFRENTKISDEMTIIRHLGSGSFGNVFLVCITGKEYALKVGLDIPPSSKQPSAIQNEMNIFGLLRQNPQHPNLIQSFPIEFPLGSAILMELGQETLDDKIKSGSLSFQQTIEIILQILSAVAFLHSIGISHNDLKPDNIIFVDGVPKLFDFNISYFWKTDHSFKSHLCGTLGYKHPTAGSNYAQDAFSYCFMFIEMLIGKNIRSFNSKTLSGIAELSDSEIETELQNKQISRENIQKICLIYSMRTTIELNRLIELAQSIQ